MWTNKAFTIIKIFHSDKGIQLHEQMTPMKISIISLKLVTQVWVTPELYRTWAFKINLHHTDTA